MNKLQAALSALLIGTFAYAVATFISAFFVKILWNAVLPELFHAPVIGYWQAWLLNMLCVVLFKPTPNTKTN